MVLEFMEFVCLGFANRQRACSNFETLLIIRVVSGVFHSLFPDPRFTPIALFFAVRHFG
jgi:hypothetical protein